MQLTDQHEMIRTTIRKFVENELNPNIEQWEREGRFPIHEVFKQLGDLGMLGLTKPEKYGGGDLDLSYSVVMAEALGWCDVGGVPLAIGVQTDMATPALARFGSDELRDEFLAPSIAGDLGGCIGVSETGSGSDVASIKTTAVKDGDDYVINGSKMWITNGVQGDWMCTLVNTGEGKPHKNKSLVIIPLDAKGVDRTRKLDKLGMRSSDTAEIYLDDVRVPQRYRIGDEGHGFFLQMFQFQEERLWAAAKAAASYEKCVQLTIEYTRERKACGPSIRDTQYVHYRLAELATELEALRALVYRATELHCRGEVVTRLASMAKLKAGRLGRELTDWCLQFHGAMGYMWETKITRAYRDARLASIGGGADEVMLSIICKLDGTLPRKPV